MILLSLFFHGFSSIISIGHGDSNGETHSYNPPHGRDNNNGQQSGAAIVHLILKTGFPVHGSW